MQPDDSFVALGIATTGYAAFLERYKHLIEPHGTWIEVALGTGMCLAAAAGHVRLRPDCTNASWQTYERAVWRAFIIGGAPIIAWQITRSVTTLWRELRYRRENATHDGQRPAQETWQPPPARLATKRGPRPTGYGNGGPAWG